MRLLVGSCVVNWSCFSVVLRWVCAVLAFLEIKGTDGGRRRRVVVGGAVVGLLLFFVFFFIFVFVFVFVGGLKGIHEVREVWTVD